MGFVANYLGNLGRVATGRQPLRPLLFSYYVTHRCGLGCRYCCDGEGTPFKEVKVPELPLAEARRLLTGLRGHSDTLDLTGGEPLVRTDLEELLAHARALNFRTVLNTKGLGLPERPELAKLSDVLALSVDSLDPDRLSTVLRRPRHLAEKVLRTLDWVLSLGKDLKSRVVLSTVASPDTLDDVSAVLRFAQAHSLSFAFSPEIVGRTVHPGLRDNPRYVALVNEAIAAKAQGARVLGVDPYLRGIRDLAAFDCHPMLMPTIRPDGRMNYPCVEVADETFDLLAPGGFGAAIEQVRARGVPMPSCAGRCHLFCHMALSLLQRHPLAALDELRRWS
jgi:MoaA/NifB/PqqE/SkfB family radical SAM enzyme